LNIALREDEQSFREARVDEITVRVYEDLVKDEGWRQDLYKDHLGFYTIGYGFMVDPAKNGRIPRPVADFWLRWEIEDRRRQLNAALPWFSRLPDGVTAALLNMAYQLGVNGVLRFRKMLAALQLGQYARAADEALDSNWARQTPARARRVAALIRGGK
jgi:lysozyme